MSRARSAAAAMSGVLGLALLSGCANTQNNVQEALGEEPRTLTFECDDDLDFKVSLSSEEARVEPAAGITDLRKRAGRGDAACTPTKTMCA